AVVFFLGTFPRHAEVDDGQQHEYEGLNRPDEKHVKRLPKDERDRRHENRQKREQVDHQQSREDVAEQPQGQRDGLGELLDDVDRYEADPKGQIGIERLREAQQISAQPQGAQAVVLDDQDDERRQGERLVDVGRRRTEVGVRQRQEVQPVRDQDVHEDGGGDGQDESRVFGALILLHASRVREEELEHHLQLSRDAVAEAVGDQEAKRQRHYDRKQGRSQRVDREGAVVELADHDREAAVAANRHQRVRSRRRLREISHRCAVRTAVKAAAPASSSWEAPTPPSTNGV